jgi:hypothetical protein
MKNPTIPELSYSRPTASNGHRGWIEADGKVVHEVVKTDEFYKVFGFTQEMARSGILPDEFIWEEYLRSPALTACFQKHLVEYLLAFSPPFKEKHGEQCELWLAENIHVRAPSRRFCATCKMKQFCSSTQPHSTQL